MDNNYTIGVMIGNSNSPYIIETVNGIYEAAEQMNVNVICFTGAHSSYFYRKYYKQEKQEDYSYQSSCVFDYDKLCHIDALVVSYSSVTELMSERELAEFKKRISHIPTVYLENDFEGRNIRHIIDDSNAGMTLIMNHMIRDHGYEKILYLSGPKGNYESDERLRAYKDAMIAAGLYMDNSMIEYGDFSDNIGAHVEKLLDMHPDADALVCANDMMAHAAYSVIKARRIKYEEALENGDKDGIERYKKYMLGESSEHSIAITGYDDVPDSANVDPPLTTVIQSPYSHGYMAIKTVISLIEDEENTKSINAAPRPVFRQSCGCRASKHLEFPTLGDRYVLYPEQYSSTVAEILVNGMLPTELNETVTDEVHQEIYDIILKNVKCYLGISPVMLSADDMLEDVKTLMDGPVTGYAPKMAFVSAINDYLVSVLTNAKNQSEREILTEAFAKISDYIYSQLFTETRSELMVNRRRTWFMPLISRDMANNLGSLKDMYYNAIAKLQVLEIGDAYLFVTDEVIEHRKNEKWECPEKIKLVAASENGVVTAYDPEIAPVISKDNVLNNYIKGNDEHYRVSLVNLYSGEKQYGIIVAKTLPKDGVSLYSVAVQISTALNYCEMARAQIKTRSELESVIKEVEDKNEILRTLSEYDQLTDCYNRRGFLEKGSELIKGNIGCRACVVFADLDHLKEINDKYGHSEGDYAIGNVAANIRKALPGSAILARLGGDEFTAAFLVDEGMDIELLVNNISNTSVQFNSISAKPYYVECSVGYKVFECTEDTSLEKVIEMADEVLYVAKARRRKSIVKRVSVV